MSVEPTITRYADGLELRFRTNLGPMSYFLPQGAATRLGIRLIEADIALAEARIAIASAGRLVAQAQDDPGDMLPADVGSA